MPSPSDPATLALVRTGDDESARTAFSLFLKPRLSQLLRTFRMDVVFHRAQGDWLYLRDGEDEVAVLDVVGGFGAALLGHNHSEIADALRAALTAQRPMFAQASVRAPAALLAERLSALVGRTTGRSYVATLANSGAEVVEAALKHAALTHHRRGLALVAAVREDNRRFRRGLVEGALRPAGDLLDQAEALLGGYFETVGEVLAAIETAAKTTAAVPPRFLAVEGGFHGKSSGALQLTHRAEFRDPWARMGVAVAFVGREDVQALDRQVAQARQATVLLDFRPGGEVGLKSGAHSSLAGLFCEPVQGEGGIHELPPAMWRAYRAAADAEGFPLIVDEIQSGLGRCGAFLASADAPVRGDYYLFAKALGGGLTKLAALLVDDDLVEPDFDYLHSSTFADDDLSCGVAHRALDILERDNIAERCAERGGKLLAALNGLKAAFPDQIGAVRGRGLMIGLELTPQIHSTSPLLRVISEQGLLGFLAAGYLFNRHRVRIAPTLADRTVLRIEPSAYIGDAEITRLIDALTAFLSDLKANAIADLILFMIGDEPAARATPSIASTPLEMPVVTGVEDRDIRVGFVVHFTRGADLKAWDPGLAELSDAQCDALLERTQGLLEPFIIKRTLIRSSTGDEATVTIIGAPFTPEQAIANLRSGCDGCSDLVVKAVDKAWSLGCSVVGLGGYTSIVTDSGQDLVEDRLALTTGNSLTVAAAYAGLRRAADLKGIALASSRLGVVGAAGNVAATLAELAAEHVGSIVLIGRPGGRRHLEVRAAALLAAQVLRARTGETTPLIANLRRSWPEFNLAETPDGADQILQLWRTFTEVARDAAPLRIHEGLEALIDCDLIVSATNAPKPIIHPQHLGHGPVVVCDIAIPRDVDPAVRIERPNVELVRGGMVRAPGGQDLGFAPLDLPDGELYGCLAEALVLGLVGCEDHFSHGPLSVSGVKQIAAWAEHHGFEMSS
jgi:acetylornithine/succinyldiaminopimelate/putrescine aminotransferase/predicted amino acid dehydrogenase